MALQVTTDWPAIIAAFGPALTALALVIAAGGTAYNTYQNAQIRRAQHVQRVETSGLKDDVKDIHTLVNSDKTASLQAQLILVMSNRALLLDTPPSSDRDTLVTTADARIAELKQTLSAREQQATVDAQARGAL